MEEGSLLLGLQFLRPWSYWLWRGVDIGGTFAFASKQGMVGAGQRRVLEQCL
jgi:hypothetical protein